MPASIFLETSLQTHRVLIDRSKQPQFEAHLCSLSPNLYSSNYVWMEYQRTVIADYAHIHRLMRKYQGWGQVIAQFAVGQRSFRPQATLRCAQILGLLFEESAGDWDLAISLVEKALRIDLRSYFWTYVSPLTDPIGCDLIPLGIQRQTDSTFAVAATCRREMALCHLPDFLAEHHTELQAISTYLSSHPRAIKNQTKVEHLLKEVLLDPRAALGQTACWPLGDVIIALQVPPGMALWTRDPDFAALATVLGIPLYSPQ